MRENMRIWDAVSKTNPAYTKKVNQRGGFTAISAHYQIMQATETFGPIGIGWGYENGHPIFQDGLVIVPVTIWHGDRANTFGPLYGSAEVHAFNKLDSDCAKKASTDGLTKGLSQLGFNADVFLGRFDDNKYVQEVTQEFAGAKAAQPGTAEMAKPVAARQRPEKLTGFYKTRAEARVGYGEIVRELHACGDEMTLDGYLATIQPQLKQFEEELPDAWNGDGADFLGLRGEIHAARVAAMGETMVDRVRAG